MKKKKYNSHKLINNNRRNIIRVEKKKNKWNKFLQKKIAKVNL